MRDWKTLDSKLIHETPWFKIVEDKVLSHTGKELTYTYLQKKRPSVAVVAVNKKGEILLQKQYVYPVRKTLWTVPCGHCDEDEAPLDAAKRELKEEAGLVSEEWHELGMFYSGAGISHNVGYGFYAKVDSDSTHIVDKDEALSQQQFVNIDKLREMLGSYEVVDGFSLIPIYQYLGTLTDAEAKYAKQGQ